MNAVAFRGSTVCHLFISPLTSCLASAALNDLKLHIQQSTVAKPKSQEIKWRRWWWWAKFSDTACCCLHFLPHSYCQLPKLGVKVLFFFFSIVVHVQLSLLLLSVLLTLCIDPLFVQACSFGWQVRDTCPNNTSIPRHFPWRHIQETHIGRFDSLTQWQVFKKMKKKLPL